jgi:glycosyltransferase involved in cell wall biosynthesis
MLAAQSWLKTWHKQVDRFIALTEFSQTKFIGGGIPASKICVKPNFVWPDPGTRTGEREYALYVGRLAPEKGLQILLEAWERLPETVPLRIIGGGPLKDQLCADVRAAHRRNVSLVGSLPNADVISAMRQARFLVFPSIWFEGFPMTLLEAFACGLASITSRLGSMAEIVTDRKTGLHFEPGDSADLAGKVMWAWSHQEEMQQMGRAARVEYETRYTAEKNLALLLNIYRDAISGRCGVGNFIHDPERIEPSTVQGGDTSE